ncbi:hypothetical protein LTR70_010488 [Exophiala xenobiotica]|uniref:Uncharacterized protein n=1 Tax=Lithohypha guttulata TaxID=1690604 RepID=A0ABR0JU59_9EURO|nr:hypothetical protein LTR24_010347 [Lithohypha guttulata]KAK5309215.1 hypothetical protein LTR70_010488 [Exophiala xenobiotica]
MGYAPFSPIAPALINVLCVPAGRKSAGIITHRAPDQEPQAEGHASALLFHFTSHSDPNFVQHTKFFEPNRRPQIALGIIDGSSLPPDAFDAALEHAQSRLRQISEQASATDRPIKLIVFDAPNSLPTSDAVFVHTDPDKPSVCELIKWLSEAVALAGSHTLDVVNSEEAELPQSVVRSERLNGAEARPDSRTENSQRQSVIPSLGRKNTQTAPVPEDQTYEATSGKIVSAALVKLLIGQWAEALPQLVDGARAARDANSPAWHAKALEGMLVCLLLHAWAGNEFQIPQDCYPTTRGLSTGSAVHIIADDNRTVSEKFTSTNTNGLTGLTAMLPGLTATIMNLYDRSTIGFDNGLPPILVCEMRVRLTALLIILRRHGSLLSAAALDELVGLREDIKLAPPLGPSSAALVLRSSPLSSLLVESITEAQAQLPVQVACTIYAAVGQRLAELKLERKQGFYLKDVLQKLPPVLVEARKVGAAEAAVHPSASGMNAFASTDKHHAIVAQGVRALLKLTMRTFNIPDLWDTYHRGGDTDSQATTRKRLSSWLSVFTSGDIATKLEVLRLCVRVSDALPDLIGSTQFMGLLLFVARQQITVFPDPSNTVPLIAMEEQTRLANGINNAVSATQRSGVTKVLADYWDDFLIRGIELYESPSAGKLMPHSSQDLSLTTTSGTSKKDPFIYNPFSGDRKTSGPAVLVKDEVASFDVILQNPLEIDIEVENISLLSESCRFEAEMHSVVIGPLTTQGFTLQGTPKETGSLKIIGCHARIRNCHERDFTVYSGLWKPPEVVKRKQLRNIEVSLPETRTLELKVVDPLPQLRICSTTLTQQSIMLLDGEKCRFSLTLENADSIPADLILFSYQDSVSRQLQDALATKDLQPSDTYELQHQLMHRQAIRRINHTPESNGRSSSTAAVEASSKQTFEFEVLGKPGLTEVVVLVDYAYLAKPRNEVEGTFYTRQLRFVVNVTVNGSVDVPRCAIVSIPEQITSPQAHPTTPQTNGKAPAAAAENEQKDVATNQGKCLLQLDLRSLWQTSLNVTIETTDPTTTSSPSSETPPNWTPATTMTLLPTQTARTLTLFTRLYIPSPHAQIPTLTPSTTRQFVVSASKLSLEAELATRETFWYHDEICKRVRIRWREESTHQGGRGREGEIDTRKAIRLSPRMIDALRVEHLQVSFDLVAEREEDESKVVRKGSEAFEVRRNVFAKLIVRVRNLGREEVKLLLRLQPCLADQPHGVAMDLGKKFVWSGVLQRVFRGGIAADESATSELGVVGLAPGSYEVNATVEEVRARSREVEGVSGGNAERRIWHARRPASIVVVE